MIRSAILRVILLLDQCKTLDSQTEGQDSTPGLVGFFSPLETSCFFFLPTRGELIRNLEVASRVSVLYTEHVKELRNVVSTRKQ